MGSCISECMLFYCLREGGREGGREGDEDHDGGGGEEEENKFRAYCIL